MRMVRIDPTLGCLGFLLIAGLIFFGITSALTFLVTTPLGLGILGAIGIYYVVKNWSRFLRGQQVGPTVETFGDSAERSRTEADNPFEAAERAHGFDRSHVVDVVEYQEVQPGVDPIIKSKE